jgi:hypothetical protein
MMPVLVALAMCGEGRAASGEWPQFRGPNASGVSEDGTPPIQFGPDSNRVWRADIPAGLSCPVVSGGRVFITGQEADRLLTLAFDLETGRELWRRPAPASKLEQTHRFSSPAAPTPCTDGRRVFAYFGSFGLLAYDRDGHELWQRPFERLPTEYGTASSPILAGGQLILQRDGDSTNAQLVALAPDTGKTLWVAPRPMAGASYSTPMVWRHDGVEELLVQGKGRLAAYGLRGGDPAWWVRGWGFAAVTTPVAGDGMLFVGGSGMGDPAEAKDPLLMWSTLIQYDANHDGSLSLNEIPADVAWHIRKEIPREVPGNNFRIRDLMNWYADSNKDGVVTKAEWDALEAFSNDKFNADRFVAIRPSGKGDVTATHVVWETTKGLSEMPSPLFYKGRVHFLRDGGLWTSLDPATGRRILDRERLGIGGQAVASPIAANGCIYIVNEGGTFAVVRAGDTLEVAAINKLGESVRSTPAIAGNRLVVRSAGHLWAFGH